MTDHPQVQESRPRWALVVAMALFVVAVALVVTSAEADRADPGATSETPAMLAVAPGGTVELASLPAEHRTMYRSAAHDPEGFGAVACYCGCEDFLGHRYLLDCFVRADGGWERHATGCAVCLAEARDVVEMRTDGNSTDAITRHIDDTYGVITAPTT